MTKESSMHKFSKRDFFYLADFEKRKISIIKKEIRDMMKKTSRGKYYLSQKDYDYIFNDIDIDFADMSFKDQMLYADVVKHTFILLDNIQQDNEEIKH